MKRCTQCSALRPLGEFSAHKLGKGGKHPWCAACRSAKSKAHYRAQSPGYRSAKSDRARCRAYGLLVADYERMYAAQHHCCAICGKPETFVDARTGRVRRLSIDHCHKTDIVRGLLCHRCNTSLGHYDDSPHLLRAAAYYLERNV